MFVLHTDVVSRTSPLSGDARRVREWLLAHEGLSRVSVVTLAELHFGVERLRRRGPNRKADLLSSWLNEIEEGFSSRLLPIDAPISRRTGALLARAEAAGSNPGFADACIAATADLAGFEVVTFNARHFSAFGVSFRVPDQEGAE